MQDPAREIEKYIEKALQFSALSLEFASNAPEGEREYFLRQAFNWEAFAHQAQEDARRIAECQTLLLRFRNISL
jgi:hypothetical protein